MHHRHPTSLTICAALCFAALCFTGLAGAAPPTEPPPGPVDRLTERPWHLDLHAELGSLFVASHTVQLGRDGSDIDYVDDLGQQNLVPFARLSADLHLGESHVITLLYQPLSIQSTVTLQRDLVIDGETFAEGTAVRSTYDFPFARISYLYDLFDGPDELGIGLSLQLRNATLAFEQLDGPAFRSRRDIGPVPILKLRWRQWVSDGVFIGAEIDGFYAPIKYLNGGETDVEGAIVDASLRAGLALPHDAEVFLNLRWLGGGAEGESDDPDVPGDGFNANWLHFVALSLGLSYVGL